MKPFTLRECERYASASGLAMTRQQILETYMILGGVPYYWSLLKKGISVARNIDEMFFAENARLEGEFSELYAALFKHPDPYIAVVEELASKGTGASREEIVKGIKMKDGGKITTILEDLENCGFIRKYNRIGARSKYALYQLIDNFTVFHYKFLAEKKNNDPAYWELLQHLGRDIVREGMSSARSADKGSPQHQRSDNKCMFMENDYSGRIGEKKYSRCAD